MRVLLVEDNAELARLVGRALDQAGLVADRCHDIGEARAAVRLARYDLAILDRRLPDGDGMSLISELRARQAGIRVIMLTALDAVSERVAGLDAGADDYLVKPFAMPELLARIRAGSRRNLAETGAELRLGRIRFDAVLREARLDGAVLKLQRRELALFEALLRRAGSVILRETLMEQVYGLDDAVASNALDSQISRLRRRLSELGSGIAIHPVRGVGYMMIAE